MSVGCPCRCRRNSSAPLTALMGMVALAGVGVAAVAVSRRKLYAPVPTSEGDARARLLESGAGGSYGAVTNTKLATRDGSYSSLAEKTAPVSSIESL